jgi:hypothetical protein
MWLQVLKTRRQCALITTNRPSNFLSNFSAKHHTVNSFTYANSDWVSNWNSISDADDFSSNGPNVNTDCFSDGGVPCFLLLWRRTRFCLTVSKRFILPAGLSQLHNLSSWLLLPCQQLQFHRVSGWHVQQPAGRSVTSCLPDVRLRIRTLLSFRQRRRRLLSGWFFLSHCRQ